MKVAESLKQFEGLAIDQYDVHINTASAKKAAWGVLRSIDESVDTEVVVYEDDFHLHFGKKKSPYTHKPTIQAIEEAD